MKVLYLPPYCPFLNPFENGFSKWKNHVTRGKAQNEAEVRDLFLKEFDSVTEKDCQGYFKKMTGYVARSLAKGIIME